MSDGKQRPILFSTPMVQAILEGRKTVTRRTRGLDKLNEEGFWNYSHNSLTGEVPHPAKKYDDGAPWYLFNPKNSNAMSWIMQCPYGKVGDILYVRESFHDGYNGMLDPNIGKEEKDWTMHYWVFKDGAQMYSTGEYFPGPKDKEPNFATGTKWRPSIHMPKAACRIWLQIVSIRLERLNEINHYSALAEGIEVKHDDECDIYKDYEATTEFSPFGDTYYETPFFSFKSLWKKINGIESWDKNPWVWVVEFKRIEKP